MENTSLMISFSTNLIEATLENLLVAWGYQTSQLAAGTFNIGEPEEAVERSVVVVGRAPRTATDAPVERIYYARRVVSMEGSSHALNRTEATMFPVNFRLMSVPGAPNKSEYGTIRDRPLTAA